MRFCGRSGLGVAGLVLLLVPVAGGCGDGPATDAGGCRARADCDDGDACNGIERCLGDGTCAPGEPPDCSPLDGQCTAGECDPERGCVQRLLAEGTGCEDGLHCTTGDACAASGVCTGGPPPACSELDGLCQVGVCDEALDACTAEPTCSWSYMWSTGGIGLWGVWGTGADDVFAVGASDQDTATVLHYDGALWTVQYDAGGLGWLLDVHGTSPGDVFAVGKAGTIVHYDGAAWLPQASGTEADLKGVWAAAPDDVFAVGFSGNAVDGYTGIVLHYDGTTWSPQPAPPDALLFAVWGSGPLDVYAVGVDTVLHYDGEWSEVFVPDPPFTSLSVTLQGVWGTGPGDIYAVGLGVGGGSSIYHYDGAAWTKVMKPIGGNFQDVWASGPDDYWIIGFNTILHRDAKGWTWERRPDLPTRASLHAIWGAGPADIFIAAGGVILHYGP